MNVSIVSLVFPPEPGGSPRRVAELAEHLKCQGHDVSVITGFPSYPTGIVFGGYRKRLMSRTRWEDSDEGRVTGDDGAVTGENGAVTGDGGRVTRDEGRRTGSRPTKSIDLRRVWLYTSPQRKRFAARLMHYVTFTFSATFGGLIGPRPDVVYVTSPPYFLGLAGWLIASLRGAKLAFDVQDFWPEAPIALGWVKNRALIRFLLGLERFIYDRSSVVFALSDVMKERIVGRGVPPAKVVRVYNWVEMGEVTRDRVTSDGEEIHHKEHKGHKEEGVASDEGRVTGADGAVTGDGSRVTGAPDLNLYLNLYLSLAGKFVVLFAGNMGLAQGLDVVVDAARVLRERPEVRFVLVGEGIEKQRLQDRATSLGLENVLFLPGVPEGQIARFLGMADVLLATLGRAKHREAAIPSKVQGYMASGKPVLVAAEGATARLVEEANCGLAVPWDDAEALAQAVLRLQAMSPREREELGRAGRSFAEEHFDREKQCGKIEEELRKVTGDKRRVTGDG